MVITRSAAETEACGEAYGRTVPRGTVIALSGDLGAGKTQFVKGLARAVGSKAKVHSPTFAIVNTYDDGRIPLAHLDLYRLESPHDLIAAGVEEYLEPDGVAVIEWSEKLFQCGPEGASPLLLEAALPSHIRRVTITVVDETTRQISHDDPCA